MAKTNVKNSYNVKGTFEEMQKLNNSSKFRSAFKRILNALKALPDDVYSVDTVDENIVNDFTLALTSTEKDDFVVTNTKINSDKTEGTLKQIRKKEQEEKVKNEVNKKDGIERY